MANQSRCNSGQALVESIFGITLLTLLITLVTTLVLTMRGVFKHDYMPHSQILETQPKTQPKTQNDGLDFLGDKLISFDGGSPNTNLRSLTDSGWNIENTFRVDNKLYYLMNKDGEQMIFSNQLGVKICSGTCFKK